MKKFEKGGLVENKIEIMEKYNYKFQKKF